MTSTLLINLYAQTEKDALKNIIELHEKRKYQRSYKVNKEELSKYKNSVLFYYWLAKNLLKIKVNTPQQRTKNYKQAIRLLDYSIKTFRLNYSVYPPNKKRLIESLYLCGIAHNFIGNQKMAISYMDKVIEVDGKQDKAWFNKAVIYEKLHNLVEASKAFIRYKELQKKDDDVF